MGKIARTWSLMSDSWQVLKLDKSLIVLPLVSGICCLLLMASFAIPLWATGAWRPPGHDAETVRQVLYYGTLFAFYAANYFIVVFFNAALVACAATRMGGGEPTISDGLRAAASRLPAIAGWALISATVGLILRIIEDRSDKIVQIIAGLLGLAWTICHFSSCRFWSSKTKIRSEPCRNQPRYLKGPGANGRSAILVLAGFSSCWPFQALA